jgi:nucleotide-binding universal stress UspA family protein
LNLALILSPTPLPNLSLHLTLSLITISTPGIKGNKMIDLRRILVPTDFSVYSQHALKYAAAFSEKFNADVYLLHVFQDLAVYQPDEVTVAPPVVPSVEQLTSSARSTLQRMVEENKLQHLPVHTEVREGTAVDEIVRFAEENVIDLIVMGRHGRGWLAHVLLGSVAEKVVRRAPCPVLMVRLKEHEFITTTPQVDRQRDEPQMDADERG